MLEALWTSGDLAIAGRQGFQRLYDLSERVIPAEYLEAPIPTEQEFLREVTVWAVTARGALTESGVVEHARLEGRRRAHPATRPTRSCARGCSTATRWTTAARRCWCRPGTSFDAAPPRRC